MNKYRLTEQFKLHEGRTLWRIMEETTGRLGGWVEHERNLSQYGTCMIWGEAKVYGGARVEDDAIISGAAEVYDTARVYGSAAVVGNAKVYQDAQIYENAIISEQAQIYEYAQVFGEAEVFGEAQVYGKAIIQGQTKIHGKAQVYGNALVKDRAEVYGEVKVGGNTVVEGDEKRYEDQHDNWEEVYSLASFRLFIQRGETMESANLYANGRHQVQVEVVLEAKNKMGQYIQLTEEEVFKHVKLVSYRNEPLEGVFQCSDRAGDYTVPLYRSISQRATISYGVFYLSTTSVLGLTKICASCMVNAVDAQGNLKKIEYTTAELNRPNNNATPQFVTVNVVMPRIFTTSDLEVVVDKKEIQNSAKSALYQYYVSFKTSSAAKLHHAVFTPDLMFSNQVKILYHYYGVTTDYSWQENLALEYTRTFIVSMYENVTITFPNHEYPGVSLWNFHYYQDLSGGPVVPFTTNSLLFAIFDQFGNEAKIQVQTDREYLFDIFVI